MDTDEQIEQPEPMADDELEAKLSKFTAAEACNLRALYDKYLKGKTEKWHEEKLIACGIIGGRVKSNAEIPMQCSQTQMAAYLTETYGKPAGREYFTSQIATWIKNEGAPGPGANRYLSSAQFIKWFLENKWEGSATGGDSTIGAGAKAKQELYVVQLRRAERADKEEQRKFDARWMMTEAHDFWGVGLATITRQSMLAEHKKFLDAAKQAAKESSADDALAEKMMTALRPKMGAAFESWQADFTKRTEELDASARELSEQKKSELKVNKL
jgi:hypothetical protein